MMLDMLPAPEQHLVLQQLNKQHGFSIDVARIYSDKDIAERYGVHVRTAREWIISGRLKGCQIDRYWYSRADWLDQFDQNHVRGGEWDFTTSTSTTPQS